MSQNKMKEMTFFFTLPQPFFENIEIVKQIFAHPANFLSCPSVHKYTKLPVSFFPFFPWKISFPMQSNKKPSLNGRKINMKKKEEKRKEVIKKQ